MSRNLEFLDNLIHIQRYTPNFLICKESVADHVICMNSLAIEYTPILNKKFKLQYNIANVIYGIALHDLDESLSCDIPKKFKYHSPELRQLIGKTIEDLLTESIPEYIVRDIKYYDDKSNVYGFLIKIYDIAQAGYKMLSEIKLGNSYFVDELVNVQDSLTGMKLQLKDTEFRSDYIEGLTWLIDNFLEEFVV